MALQYEVVHVIYCKSLTERTWEKRHNTYKALNPDEQKP